ncbi:MAG: hypothetical protein ABSH12_09445 [Endomicrobiales bacterium]|jgi:hypothetical protein
MKINFIAATLVLMVSMCYAADLTRPYSPTRQEWLETQLQISVTRMNQVYGSGEEGFVKGSAITFKIDPQTKEIDVDVLVKKEFTSQDYSIYKKIIEDEIKTVLAQHKWASDLTINIAFKSMSSGGFMNIPAVSSQSTNEVIKSTSN